MKKVSLILATVMAVALLMTGCFGTTTPAPTTAPTAMPTATATTEPTATTMPTATDAPAVTDLPAASDGLEVAPSPSASTAP